MLLSSGHYHKCLFPLLISLYKLSCKIPYNEGTYYNVRYSFPEYPYMMNFVNLPSESPNLGVVLGALDTKGNSHLAANQPYFTSCECGWPFRKKKLTNSFGYSVCTQVYNLIFCIVSSCTYLVVIKNGIILQELRIFF